MTRLWHVYVSEQNERGSRLTFRAETSCPDTGWEGFGAATTEPQAVRNAIADAIRQQKRRPPGRPSKD